MEEGGTKIQRRSPQMDPQQQQEMMMDPEQAQQQQMDPRQQQMDPRQQQMLQQQMMHQQQQMHQQHQQHQHQSKKGGFIDFKSLKLSVVVALIFIILNSKIVWSQFGKLPFMGSMDPSMLALLINSLLSGIIFYIITTYVIKS